MIDIVSHHPILAIFTPAGKTSLRAAASKFPLSKALKMDRTSRQKKLQRHWHHTPARPSRRKPPPPFSLDTPQELGSPGEHVARLERRCEII
jgi:hypothetical protein